MISEEGARLGRLAAERLAELNCCELRPGLTEAEFDRIEGQFGFEFADDHRAFLAVALPVLEPPDDGGNWSMGWPDWRDGDPEALRRQLARPVEGLLWEVEDGNWWDSTWGERPATVEAAMALARQQYADVPAMVPVYAHRFMPAGRGTFGHPVLSMWGWDIIYYGSDLLEYLNQEFQEPRPPHPVDWQPKATVPFWRDCVS